MDINSTHLIDFINRELIRYKFDAIYESDNGMPAGEEVIYHLLSL